MGEKGPSDYRACSARERSTRQPSSTKGTSPLDILGEIRGKDVGLRMTAIERLAKNPRRHGKTILALANVPESDIRVLACGLIGDAKPAGALRALIEKIGDKEPNVREAACTAMGKFRSPRVVKYLTAALHDKAWVACAAASSLGEIGGKHAIRELLRIFHGKDILKGSAACHALMTSNVPEVIADIVNSVRTWRGRKRDHFVGIILERGGEEILDRLRSSLGDDLLAHLLYLAGSKDKVPLRLLTFAASFQNPEALGLILSELAKRDPDEQEYADILALLSDLHAVWKDSPEVYLSQPDKGSAIPIIKACAMTRTKISSTALLDILPTSSLETKREISGNLMLIAEPSTPLLEALLLDLDDHVKGDAAEAASFFLMKEMAPRIKELARKGYPDARQKALRSLCTLDPDAAQTLSEEFVSSGGAEDQEIYLSAAELMDKELNFQLVHKLLHSKENRVAAIAVRIMGRLIEKDSRYLDMLGELLLRKRVLPETLEIIKRTRLTALQPKLLKLLDGLRHDPWLRYQTLSALSALGDQGLFDVFAAGLKDEHNLIRIGCIKALARLGQMRAVDLISPFETAADADLRNTARTAMDTLMAGNGVSGPTGRQ